MQHWQLAAIIPIPTLLALWGGWREGKRFNTKARAGAIRCHSHQKGPICSPTWYKRMEECRNDLLFGGQATDFGVAGPLPSGRSENHS